MVQKFINKSIEIHSNKYDYSKVVYKNIDTKVSIICPIHGEFNQTPRNHKNVDQSLLQKILNILYPNRI